MQAGKQASEILTRGVERLLKNSVKPTTLDNVNMVVTVKQPFSQLGACVQVIERASELSSSSQTVFM